MDELKDRLLPGSELVGRTVPVLCSVDREAKEQGKMRIDMRGSTEHVDRYGDIIAVGKNFLGKGWQLESFRSNPVILWQHGYDAVGRIPIGTATKVVKRLKEQPRALDFTIEFTDVHPMGELAYKLYEAGVLNASSVGMRPVAWKWAGNMSDEEKAEWPGLGTMGIFFGESDLLELSAVSVPANPHALKKQFGGALALGLLKPQDLEAFDKADLHDDPLARELRKALEDLKRVVVRDLATIPMPGVAEVAKSFGTEPKEEPVDEDLDVYLTFDADMTVAKDQETFTQLTRIERKLGNPTPKASASVQEQDLVLKKLLTISKRF